MVSRAVRIFSEMALAGLAAASAAALLLGWLAVQVLNGDTVRFDAYVRDSVHAWASPSLTEAMKFFTLLGSGPGLAVVVLLSMAVFWRYGMRRAAAILAIAVPGGYLLELALKAGFHRARPAPYFGLPAPDSFSFPSGHALLSFACFAALAELAASRVERRAVKAAIWAIAATLIGLIGFSRVYLGVHYPTDVIAGYLAAFVWVFAIGRGDHYLRGRRQAQLALTRQ